MVKRCLDQEIRARNLRPEMTESRQEHQRKAKGNLSALKGSKESAINGKHKDSAQKETHVVSATMRTNVENQRAHPLLRQNRRRRTTGKLLRKDVFSEAGVRLGREIEDRTQSELHEPLV